MKEVLAFFLWASKKVLGITRKLRRVSHAPPRRRIRSDGVMDILRRLHRRKRIRRTRRWKVICKRLSAREKEGGVYYGCGNSERNTLYDRERDIDGGSNR